MWPRGICRMPFWRHMPSGRGRYPLEENGGFSPKLIILVTKVTDLRQNWSLSQGGTLTQMADFHPNWPLPPGKYQIFIKIYHFGKGVTLTKVTDSVTMNNPWACFRLFYWISCCFVAVLLKFCNLVQQFFWCRENLFFGVPTNQPTFSRHVAKICVVQLPYLN